MCYSGIYMACILYHEDKVLVTNEDFVPVIEIDETYPSCLTTDYHWLMKVACTWDDVKSLRTDMEKNATSAVHFRTKLLAAACQMQSALCVQDLGQLFHRPLRDAHGTVVLSCVNHVKVSAVGRCVPHVSVIMWTMFVEHVHVCMYAPRTFSNYDVHIFVHYYELCLIFKISITFTKLK